MLVNLVEILKIAEEKNCAIGAFNTPNLESVMAVIGAAEDKGMPVIISHAEVHQPWADIEVVGPIMINMAKKSIVPICVHLDHGTDIDYVEKALKLGFTSVMFDGSALNYEENVKQSQTVVKMAKEYKASVEGEIGIIGGRGAESSSEEEFYTDPLMAETFVKESGIDALAASFGTAHGFYIKQPKLDFDRIDEIRKKCDVPLVMHGGSGVNQEGFRKAIDNGIRKINYYSYMAKAGSLKVKEMLDNEETLYYHELAAAASNAMKENVAEALDAFANGKY